ncbi:MAG: osmotically inducible protein OsmC [Bermanella sp.]|nr:osmotically inducible protein OsmC [Bermanella sp.]
MSKHRAKIEIQGTQGKLAAILEKPGPHPKAFVLYAHCFTCGKDSLAASRISRGLVAQGYAVLRYDFAGIGHSEGQFEDTNFTTSVDDLVMVADYLKDNYQAPAILIGHSFGGAVVLGATSKIKSIKGVVTVAAPSKPCHVIKQFAEFEDEIMTKGQADVLLSGRSFVMKKQFLDDVYNQNQDETIRKMKTPLLVFHSPRDTTVLIKEAEHIYNYAKHPKSFISLDPADHLLSSSKHAAYVASSVAVWAEHYIEDNNA